MPKTNPYFTASGASLIYFITFIILKYFLHNKEWDWEGAFTGALVFWVVIFIIHQLLNRQLNKME